MADMDGVLQVEMLGHCRGIGCIMVHVVTVADLGRSAMAAAVVSDDAEALGDEKQHLRVPVVRAEGPAVMKDDRLGVLRPPIFVEDICSVFGRDEGHGFGSLCLSYRFGGGLSGSPDWGEQRHRGRRSPRGKCSPSGGPTSAVIFRRSASQHFPCSRMLFDFHCVWRQGGDRWTSPRAVN